MKPGRVNFYRCLVMDVHLRIPLPHLFSIQNLEERIQLQKLQGRPVFDIELKVWLCDRFCICGR